MALQLKIPSHMSEEEYRGRLLGYIGVILIPVALFVFFIIYWGDVKVVTGKDLTFGGSTWAVALIITGTYFYTYRFFKETFYFFIFLGWLANAIYLPFEFFFTIENDPTRYQLGVHHLSFVSTVLFALSFFTPGNKRPSNPLGIIAGMLIGIGGLSAFYYGVNYWLVHDENQIAFAWKALPGTFLSFLVLYGVGEVFRARLSREVHGWKRLLLSNTYYVYAALQFLYPFFLYLKANNLGGVPFLVAQLAKVGNAISMLGVLISAVTYRELLSNKQFQTTREELLEKEARLQRRSQLEELGALASSIEHDIKTPLATMNLNISRMRSRFQHNTEIVEKLNRLDEARQRIAATVQVIRYLRGDKAFYNREGFMDKANMLEVVHRAVKSVKNELRLDPAKHLIKVEGRDVWARAFPPMLEQVVVNVIKNGIEAIEEAERKRGIVNVFVGTMDATKGKYSRLVKIDITDNGRGIPAEHIPLLTTLFTTRNDVKPNSGIGLFIALRSMRVHEGRISFESEVDKGTTVTLLLPEWNAYQKAQSEAAESASDAEDSTDDSAELVEATEIAAHRLTGTEAPTEPGGTL